MSRDTPTIHPAFEDPENPVTESLEIGLGRRGKALDKWVTFRDLRDQGAFQVDARGLITGLGSRFGGGSGEQFAPDGGGDLDFGEDDLSIPPAPRNVRARGLSLDSIGVTWEPSPVANHAYAEIFASRQQFWSPIRDGFNAQRPIGNGNSSPNFMGRAAGNTFIHRGLTSTVPTLNLAANITGFSDASPGTWVITTGVDPSKFFIVGEKAFLTAPGGWSGNGVEGTVLGFDGAAVRMSFEFDPDPNSTSDAPSNAQLVRVPDPDDLEAALEPDPVYYWVRFVSTAGIVGPVQSEEGEKGTVMIDPEAVLNVLTGRIRKSNLANDIIAPINFISGPIGQFDSIRDFVESLGDEAVTSFSRTLWEEYLGEVTPEGATAGAALRQVRGELNVATPFIEDLNTLQLGSEGFDDFPDLMATVVQRALVQLDDGAAIAYVADNLQVEVGDDVVVFNEIGQRIFANADAIDSSITLRVQANTGGILTAAGFGIGLQGDPNDPGSLTSSVIFAADQFALMSEASGGRMIKNISTASGTVYRVNLESGSSTSSSLDGMTTGSRVAFALSPNAPSNLRAALRGRSFVVTSRAVIGSDIRISISDPDGNSLPDIGSNAVEGEGYALFPEQSIPFIVDTATGTVGIRGRLIVDGMISADEAEINDLLRAKRIWAENITAFGLVNTHSLIGQAIATPRFGGWAMRMAMPDATKGRVLEFSRWAQPDGNTDFNDPLPNTDPDATDYELFLATNQELVFPQLTDVRKIDTAFWLDSEKGSAYIRGNLTVGGNARIWTGQGAGTGDWFTQMDQEFPIMVLPKSMTGSAGIPAVEGADVVYTESARRAVRANALFWVGRDGTMGFNTQNGAIFAGDTPLEPPSGLGDIEVKARLDSGARTGRGRVHSIFTFDLFVNRTVNDWWMNTSLHMYLVDRNTNYDDSSTTHKPSSRNRLDGGPALLNPTFLDKHFLIIRATSQTSSDPGLDAVIAWESRHPEIVKMAQTGGLGPGQRTVHGTAMSVPASPNYRILVVLIERFAQDGSPIFGSSGPKAYPFSGDIFTQQVSNTQ